jgi:hypothetical protein
MDLFTKKFKKVLAEDISFASALHNTGPNDSYAPGTAVTTPGTAVLPSIVNKKRKKKKKIAKETTIPKVFSRNFPETLVGLSGNTGKMGYNRM